MDSKVIIGIVIVILLVIIGLPLLVVLIAAGLVLMGMGSFLFVMEPPQPPVTLDWSPTEEAGWEVPVDECDRTGHPGESASARRA